VPNFKWCYMIWNQNVLLVIVCWHCTEFSRLSFFWNIFTICKNCAIHREIIQYWFIKSKPLTGMDSKFRLIRLNIIEVVIYMYTYWLSWGCGLDIRVIALDLLSPRSVPTIFLGVASENSWYLGDNKSAIKFVPVPNFEPRLFVPMPGNMGRPAFTFINLYIFCNLQRIINKNIHLGYVCIIRNSFVCLFVGKLPFC
jgi:hypothetical protein